MRIHSTILLALLALLAVAPAFTDEIVHFKSGSTMAVIDHSVKDGMVQVVLGPGSQIAFPIEMVDRITNAGQDVFTSDGTGTANRMVEGRTTPVVDLTVTSHAPSSATRGKWIGNATPTNPHVSRDKTTGITVYDASEGGARVTGRLDILSGPPPAGLAPDPVTGQPPPVVGARPFGRGYIAKLPGDVNPARRILLEMSASERGAEPIVKELANSGDATAAEN